MYTSTLLLGLAAFASTAVNARAVPEQSLAKRHGFGTTGQCAAQPHGSGPVTSPDTPDAFVHNDIYSDIAGHATTPAGWSLVYQKLNAASTTTGYLGYEEIDSYDVDYCAKQCCGFWPGCKSFNIYFERNPVVDPGAKCPNPSSLTRIKCSFWSTDITKSDATNDGQYCQDFHVVIAGSNAYKGGCKPKTSTTSSSTTTKATTTSSSSTTRATTTSSSSTTRATTTSSSSTTKAITTPSTTAKTTTRVITTPSTTPVHTTPSTTRATTKATTTPCTTKVRTTLSTKPTTTPCKTTTKAAVTTPASNNHPWSQWQPKGKTHSKKRCTWWGWCH